MRTMLTVAVIAISLAGCEPAPASRQCADAKPLASTLTYACEDGTRRCTFADGSTRFVDCQLGEFYCVEECRSSQ